MGPDTEDRVGDQDRPISSGLQVLGETGHCRVRTKLPWRTYRGVFPSKCP